MCMFPVLGHPAAVILCVAGAGIVGAPASSCSAALLWVLLHFCGFCCSSLGSAALLWVLLLFCRFCCPSVGSAALLWVLSGGI